MRAHRPTSRRGSSMVWTVIALLAVMGFCSLAVDVGKVQLAKGQLRHAADAAARHAASGLATSGPSAARTNAVSAAADNKADGAPVALDATADVQFGTWDHVNKTFTAAAAGAESSANAVRVTARRTAARGNPVQLMFAGVVGRPTIDLTATATARINSRKPGIVGLDYITMSGNSAGTGNVTNSYRSAAGAFSVTSATYSRGTIASNGNISLSGNSTIYGNAHAGIAKTLSTSGGSGVTGSTSNLSKPLDYPMEAAGTAATTNNNASLPWPHYESDRDFTIGSANVTIPGGTYYVDDFDMGSGAVLTITGPATLYVTGTFELDGTINTYNGVPSNLRIVMVTAGCGVTLASNASLYADVYCPGGHCSMSGGSLLCGSVIARSVAMSGNAKVIFDESLTITATGISLVQ